jgi:hypothetical protein
MQAPSEYSIPLTIQNIDGGKKTLFFKEVHDVSTNYYKLESQDGFIPVLVSVGFGSEWSASIRNPTLRKQMILDSRLVQYVASQEFKQYFSGENSWGEQTNEYFNQLMKTFFSEDMLENQYLNVGGFSDLEIKLVPKNTTFRITEYDGAEGIEILNLNNYMTV